MPTSTKPMDRDVGGTAVWAGDATSPCIQNKKNSSVSFALKKFPRPPKEAAAPIARDSPRRSRRQRRTPTPPPPPPPRQRSTSEQGMAVRRSCLSIGREIIGACMIIGRSFATKPRFIEPGFDFGRPMFGPHYEIFDAPIQADGLPLYVDWSKVPGVIGPARDQRKHGICYICSPLSAMTSVNCLATYDSTRESIPLSMQHVIDCGTLTDGSLDGGLPWDVLKFAIKNGGVLAESVYPFTGKLGPCKYKEGLGVTIDAWKKIRPNSELCLRYALAYQPVSVDVRFTRWITVDGLRTEATNYTKGTISGPGYYTRANHSMLVYGYGVDPKGDPVWNSINSYGCIWGFDGGKCHIARGTSQGGGALGVLRFPITPLKLSDVTRVVTARCESCPKCFQKWKK